jgi:hypothetical protein
LVKEQNYEKNMYKCPDFFGGILPINFNVS